LNDVKGVQISDDTRQRVLEAARELEYVPDAAAQALASRRAQIIGLILTRSPHHIASDTFLTQILDALVQTVHEQGMRLLIDIVEPSDQKEPYLQLVRAKHIDGILLSGPRLGDGALATLEEENFPTVLLGQLPGISLYSVDVDNRAAAKHAVNHLIHLGHTRIACITNAPLYYTAATDRLAGYRDALREAGLEPDDSLIHEGDFDPQSGYQNMSSLLDLSQPPTAVFVASDVVAFGAMAAIHERGLRIPENVALVGFDDVPLARYVDPPLTTVHLPTYALARRSSEILFKLIQREKPSQRHSLLDTQLVIRRSCGAQLQV
jgi:LacI family transcriptional regulator